MAASKWQMTFKIEIYTSNLHFKLGSPVQWRTLNPMEIICSWTPEGMCQVKNKPQ